VSRYRLYLAVSLSSSLPEYMTASFTASFFRSFSLRVQHSGVYLCDYDLPLIAVALKCLAIFKDGLSPLVPLLSQGSTTMLHPTPDSPVAHLVADLSHSIFTV